MLRNLLICGLVAGFAAGLLAFGFGSLAAEPAIDQAIAFEDAMASPAGGHGAEEAPPVSRDAQKSAGLLTATVVYGLSLGGLFALGFAFAYGRIANAGPRATAYWLAAAAFVVVFLVPFLKYPASPPAASDDDTIVKRTLLYLTMIAISLLAAVAAARLRPALRERFGAHAANLGAAALYVLVVLVAALALPSIREVPSDFPATTLWRFREASVGTQAVIWTTIGLVFAPLAQRVLSELPILPRRERADARSSAAS